MGEELEKDEEVMSTRTREIRRVVQRIAGDVVPHLVAAAWKQQEGKCIEHSNTLKEFTREFHGLSEKVAVLLDRKETSQKVTEELYEGRNKNSENIVKLGKDVEWVAREQLKMERRMDTQEEVVDGIGVATGNNTKAIEAINRLHSTEEEQRLKDRQDARTLKWTAIIAIVSVLLTWLLELFNKLLPAIANHIKP